MVKISICITYYNQKDFVRESLNSVLAIDFPCDYEILCGDDGSNDGTLGLIKEYVDKYPNHIRYFVMDRTEAGKTINRASLNRLNLAKNATGDYIMFLDGDDSYCDKSFINDSLNVFEKNKGIEACAFEYKYLYEDKSEKTIKQNIKSGHIRSTDYIKNGIYIHSGAFVFKNILDKEKLDLLERINNFDDNAITIYFLQFGDIYYFDRPIYTYRQLADSLWNSANKTEQSLINAFDYKLICDSAPVFSIPLAKRLDSCVKHIYKNKKRLPSLLSTKYEKYVSIAKNHGDVFMLLLLQYQNLKFLDKIRTLIMWRNYKRKVKLND